MERLPAEYIAHAIYLVRGQRVMLDSDLARIYGVTPKRLNEQARRNRARFPSDFAFQLTQQEHFNLRSQFATSSSAHGGRRYLPYVFTEHGAIMLASVLNTPVAVEASVQVVKAFVRLREAVATHRKLAQKLAELEGKLSGHDEQIQTLFEAIRELMTSPKPERRKIGFHVRERRARYTLS